MDDLMNIFTAGPKPKELTWLPYKSFAEITDYMQTQTKWSNPTPEVYQYWEEVYNKAWVNYNYTGTPSLTPSDRKNFWTNNKA